MSMFHIAIPAERDAIRPAERAGTHDDISRFVSGWWIFPFVVLGLMSWFFILRIVFFG